MSEIINLRDKTFGAWTVVDIGPIEGEHRTWQCVCVCGIERNVRGQTLRTGASVSCGCQTASLIAIVKTKHGLTRRTQSPEYRAWTAMHMRTREANAGARENYFDRCIGVCNHWSEYENFLLDMGRIPHPGYTLDRINNHAGYSKENCRWTDKKTQAINRRTTKAA